MVMVSGIKILSKFWEALDVIFLEQDFVSLLSCPNSPEQHTYHPKRSNQNSATLVLNKSIWGFILGDSGGKYAFSKVE
jgi:hypothetical protein